MNKEELSNAISDYQKLCRGNYGAILDEIERKQNELNIILKSIKFWKFVTIHGHFFYKLDIY